MQVRDFQGTMTIEIISLVKAQSHPERSNNALVLHSSQLSTAPLLSSLHRVLDVTAVEAFALSELRQEDGSIIQREVDLLICQQAGKELDAGVSVRKCHRHPLLEATENLWIG